MALLKKSLVLIYIGLISIVLTSCGGAYYDSVYSNDYQYEEPYYDDYQDYEPDYDDYQDYEPNYR